MKRKTLPKNRKYQLKSMLSIRNTATTLMLLVFCVAITACNNQHKSQKDAAVAVTESSGLSKRSPSTTASIIPTDLQCEYLTNPLGIDMKQPRLSWKLKATEQKARGQAQRAYRILVAGSEKLLAQNQGDLWDSGEVISGQSNLVIYRGSALSSGMRCYWKVRIRDNHGELSEWSKPARWTMGLLSQSDWSAKWIGTEQQFAEVKKLPPEGKYLSDPWFRKVITLKEKPRWATMYVASVGYHELFVNGKKVTE